MGGWWVGETWVGSLESGGNPVHRTGSDGSVVGVQCGDRWWGVGWGGGIGNRMMPQR